MPTYATPALETFCQRIFVAAGVPSAGAATVARSLVDALNDRAAADAAAHARRALR